MLVKGSAYIDSACVRGLKVDDCLPSTGDFRFVRRSKTCDNCVMQSAELVNIRAVDIIDVPLIVL